MRVIPPTQIERYLPFIDRYTVTRSGQVLSRRDMHPLVQRSTGDGIGGPGLRYVDLMHAGKVWRVYVHVLVALAHIPKPEGNYIARHVDGIASHNHAENLEWVPFGTPDRTGARCCPACGQALPVQRATMPKAEAIAPDQSTSMAR